MDVRPWPRSADYDLDHPHQLRPAMDANDRLTPIDPASSAAARQGLGLPAENAALYVSRVTLPGGVRMQVGTAGEAFGQPGGWAQAQLLERIPLSSFRKGVPLP